MMKYELCDVKMQILNTLNNKSGLFKLNKLEEMNEGWKNRAQQNVK